MLPLRPSLCVVGLYKTQTKTRCISGPSRNPRLSWIFAWRHQSGKTVVGIPGEQFVSRHTWSPIYQPSVKTIITFRFLRVSSTLSFGSRERHKLRDFPHKYTDASGVPEQQTPTGSAASPRTAIPSWACVKQQLEKWTYERTLQSQGELTLCWQATTVTFAQQTRHACKNGSVGHKFNAYPVDTQESHFGVKPNSEWIYSICTEPK